MAINLNREVARLMKDAALRNAGADQLNGLGFHKKFKKAFKKIAKVTTKIVAAPIGLVNKKTLASVVKGIKKAAPVALAATATFYGGPQAGAAVMSLASATSSNPKTARKLALGAGAIGIYGIGRSIYDANQATNMATQKADSMLQQQGINMSSPAAQNLLKMYMAEKQAKVDREVIRQQEKEMAQIERDTAQAYAQQNIPKPSTGMDMKTILPIAAGVIAIPLLMR